MRQRLTIADIAAAAGVSMPTVSRVLNQRPDVSPETRERVLGPEHPDTAQSIYNLAVLYKNQGKYELAEPLYQQALAIDEKVYGQDHPEVATDLNSLANLYTNQGKYEQAEPLYQRALAIREQVFGSDHPATIRVRENYADLLEKMEQKTKAVSAKPKAPRTPMGSSRISSRRMSCQFISGRSKRGEPQ